MGWSYIGYEIYKSEQAAQNARKQIARRGETAVYATVEEAERGSNNRRRQEAGGNHMRTDKTAATFATSLTTMCRNMRNGF